METADGSHNQSLCVKTAYRVGKQFCQIKKALLFNRWNWGSRRGFGCFRHTCLNLRNQNIRLVDSDRFIADARHAL
jgi:hypothetical protein